MEMYYAGLSYPSPNWVNMNICNSCASLGNKNKMYALEVKRPPHYTLLSSHAQHLIYCYAYQILKSKLISFDEETLQFPYWLLIQYIVTC